VNVMVDRHSVARNKRKRFSVRIRTAKLRGRSHRITVRVAQNGASGRKTVHFRTCG
jgi:hypothetical protein